MILPGLVSITFRQLAPAEIAMLARDAGLAGIEWGGDIHVPCGHRARAREVRQLTLDAGLNVVSYGSYYRVGEPTTDPFERVLETAIELGAPSVRVWAGKRGSAAADDAYRAAVELDGRRIANQAAAAGLNVAYEFHGQTLTDTAASARALMESLARTNVRSYWQPRTEATTVADNLSQMAAVAPWLSHLHVFNWRAESEPKPHVTRQPLRDGMAEWKRYLAQARRDGKDRYAMLEFVRDDTPAAFREDAAALLDLLRQA